LRLWQSEHESQINSIGGARRAGNFSVLESKVTTTKDADAADLYERLLTIQNAADSATRDTASVSNDNIPVWATLRSRPFYFLKR
jgi:hypothetical protein